MSENSRIEWTEATWNPVTGCTKVSQGCKNCYAKRDWARLAAMPGTVYHGRAFEDVQCHPERLDIPLRWRKPRRVFVNSMSDLFHEDVPEEFIDRVFAVMVLSPQHTFQVLTKRPERMSAYMNATMRLLKINARIDTGREIVDYGGWPLPNIWLGVSVEDQTTADQRIPLLLQTPAAVRWISAEPLIGPLDLDRTGGLDGYYVGGMIDFASCTDNMDAIPRIDWVVVGGESGPNARPMHPDWARSLRDQCITAGVPFFFKQWGNWLGAGQDGNPAHRPMILNCADFPLLTTKRAAGRQLDGRTWDEYPIDGRL